MAFIEMFFVLILMPGIVVMIAKTSTGARFMWYVGTVFLTFAADALVSLVAPGGGIAGILLVGGGLMIAATGAGTKCPKCGKRVSPNAQICAYCASPAWEAEGAGTKECPFCAETILAKARKCKHCGEMLQTSAV